MERVLIFNYPFEFIEKVNQLKSALNDNKIEFVCHESNGYYPHQFIIRKSDKKWNDICKIINSVMAAKYNFRKAELERRDGKLIEIVRVQRWR